MIRKSKVFLVLILGLSSFEAPADRYGLSPSCSKPFKPFQFNSQWEVENFKSEVERYKRCISEFVEEQYEAINRHQQAADEAIEEWNDFVRRELN